MDTKSTRSTLSTHSASLAEYQAEGARGFAEVRVVHAPDPRQVGTRAQLSGAVLPIGRDPREDGLFLEDTRLSRIHARITFDLRARGYRIGDARSRNGTYVNGEP